MIETHAQGKGHGGSWHRRSDPVRDGGPMSEMGSRGHQESVTVEVSVETLYDPVFDITRTGA